jgi:hypothetical protein
MCYSSFCCCELIPETINLKRGKVYGGNIFGGFRPWSVGPIAFGPVVRQHMTTEHMAEQTVHLMAGK